MQPHEDPTRDLLKRLEARVRPFPGSVKRLDPNLAAAFVDGALLPEERARLRATLDADGAAELDRYLMEAAADSSADRPARRAPVFHLRWRPVVAVAAVLLVAVGVFWALTPSAITEGDVNDAIALLAKQEPALFGDAGPVTAGERALATLRKDHGLRAHAPRAFVLDAMPTLRWSDAAGAGPYTVIVQLPGLPDIEKQGVTTTSISWSELGLDALAPGDRARWRVVAGPRRASLPFQVMSAEAAARFRAQVAAIDAHVDRDVRPVVAALIALRSKLYDEVLSRLPPEVDNEIAVDLRRRVRSVLEYPRN